jgi:hypothetical protein
LLKNSGGRFRFLLKDDPLLRANTRVDSLADVYRIASALSATPR